MKDYTKYLEENKEILRFIKENKLLDDINEADNQACEYADDFGNQYLHADRYSKIYDVIRDKNINIERIEIGRYALKIVELLETKCGKYLEDMINDCFPNEYYDEDEEEYEI